MVSKPFIEFLLKINLITESEKSRGFIISDDNITELKYPVLIYPKKVKSLRFQKQTIIEGKLLGIKGQYLLLEQDQVFNVRAHQGYLIDILI